MLGISIVSCPAMSLLMLTLHVNDLQGMLFSAMCSSENIVAPYATSQNVGEQPLFKEQSSTLRRDTLGPTTQIAARQHNDPAVTSKYLGGQLASHAIKCSLVLHDKLSKTVFRGRYK